MVEEQHDFLERLRAAIAAGPSMRFAVLMGSFARDAAGPDSDVDVGIVPSDPSLPLAAELELQNRLSEAVGREVDLVRLDGDDLLLGREAALHGVLLFEETKGVYARHRARATSDWLDFEVSLGPARERWLERLATRGSR